MAAPVLLTVLLVSETGWQHFAWMAFGVGFTLFAYWASAFVQEWLGDPDRTADETLFASASRIKSLATRRLPTPATAVNERSGLLRRASDWIERNFPGYLEGGQILPGHLQAFWFMGLTLLVYAVGFFWLDPAHGRTHQMPALGYVLVILLMFAWLLAGLSFFFDRYRVPVTLVVVVALTGLNLLAETDHYFPLIESKTAAGFEGAPIQASFRESESTARSSFPTTSPGARKPPIVVVAASGGGIKASLWTATVLTGLQRDLGDGFTGSVRLISTVSGGSAGALFYLDQLHKSQGLMTETAMKEVLQHAGATSLHGSAWGLAYPDLLRAFAPWLMRLGVNQQRDRGWALEEIWRKNLTKPNRGLAEWAREVEHGRLPAVVFNATQVESGSHFMLSSLQIQDWKRWGSHGHFERYGGYDVPAATAARLSAAFPWITPISRPDPYTEDEEEIAGKVPPTIATQLRGHLADGGYYDNFGVVSVLHWLETVLGAKTVPGEAAVNLEGRDVWVLLIRASAYDPDDPTAGRSSEQKGWIHATAGPALAMLNVRNSTQFSRNKKELELLGDRWCAESGVTINSLDFQLDREGPLSWKLTDHEYCRIVCGWHDEINLRSRRKLRAAFAKLAGSGLPAAGQAAPDRSWLPERCAHEGQTTQEICDSLSPPADPTYEPPPLRPCGASPDPPSPTATPLPSAP